MKAQKQSDPEYKQFIRLFEQDPEGARTKALARNIKRRFSLGTGDADTPLADAEGTQAYKTGVALRGSIVPEVIFVSPYVRTQETLAHIVRGWPELKSVTVYEDVRIREQEHGLALLYNDWRVFHTLEPQQRELFALEGEYWYRYPQGENVPDVQARNLLWFNTMTRDFAEKGVLAITHHLNILAVRANLERWSPQKFLQVNREDRPINCGVTTYLGHPEEGRQGRLVLHSYNVRHY